MLVRQDAFDAGDVDPEAVVALLMANQQPDLAIQLPLAPLPPHIAVGDDGNHMEWPPAAGGDVTGDQYILWRHRTNRRGAQPAHSPAACELRWLPDSLLNASLTAVCTGFRRLKNLLVHLPPALQAEVYERMFLQGRICELGYDLSDLDVFERVLMATEKRHVLHRIFQSIIDHGPRISETLVTMFCHRCSHLMNCGDSDNGRTSALQFRVETDNCVVLGFNLGRFLAEAGWYACASQCLISCQRLIDHASSGRSENWVLWRKLECCSWLLECDIGFCRYTEARQLLETALSLATRLNANVTLSPLMNYVSPAHRLRYQIAGHVDCDQTAGEQLGTLKTNLARLYIQCSLLYFCTGVYDESIKWAIEALRNVSDDTPIETVIDVCRHASKVLVVRRQFKQADLLIRHAVCLAKSHKDGAKLCPDVLLDYGFYLMNIDQTESATRMYQMGLDYRKAQFGGQNLKVAQAYEDLAYSLYVKEYSSGRFQKSRDLAEKAVATAEKLLPVNHLQLASGRRVKALILEEMAIDCEDKTEAELLLREAETLHLSALTLCKRTFGDMNVQTAKHYGNLGRLFQSMKNFQQAEAMHKKAIDIKQQLLGNDDYEVALSTGHLAALYNYDMNRQQQAEKLYLRSIEIGRTLFGEAYTGLEYDYRGLVHCYVHMGDEEGAAKYVSLLNRWNLLREQQRSSDEAENLWTSLRIPPRNTSEIIGDFFKKFK